MRILLIEDDTTVAKSIELMLRAEGHSIDHADLGEDGLDIGRLYEYDIIILDMMLPDIDGLEVLRGLRAARIQTPVLVLSGLGDTRHKLTALDAGSDDYLVKPFNKEELIARLRAIVRRSRGFADNAIRIGRLKVDIAGREAFCDDERLHLTGKEFDILNILATRRGTAVSKDQLLTLLYGGMDEPEPKIIDVFICKLRKKLAAAIGSKDVILTVWGRGYKLGDVFEKEGGPSSGRAGRSGGHPAAPNSPAGPARGISPQ